MTAAGSFQSLSRWAFRPVLGLLALAGIAAWGSAIALYSSWLAFVPMVLAVVLLVLAHPYWGYLLVVATLPADVAGTLGGGERSMVVTVPKLVGLLTLAACAVDFLYRRSVVTWRRWLVPEIMTTALFIAVMLVSAAVHPGEMSSAEITRLITIFVFMLVSIQLLDRPERVVHVVGVVIATATILAVQSVLQRLAGRVILSEDWTPAAGAVLDVGEEITGTMLRTSATFSHPAWLGLFLTVALPMTLFAACSARHRLLRWLCFPAVLLQLLGILSTYSRMAYVGAALGLILFLSRRRHGALLLGAFAAGMIIAYPSLPQHLRARAESIIGYGKSSSSLTRIGQQYVALAMFQDHPWLGIGPGNFEAKVGQYARRVPERFPAESIGAHNMYAEVAAELGMVGLSLIVLLLLTGWHGVRRLRRRAYARRSLRHALLWESIGISLIVFMVSALAVHAQQRKEWWLLLSLVAAGRTLYGRGRGQDLDAQEAAR